MYEDTATKFPNRSGPSSEFHEGDNPSTKSKIAINATVLSNAVEKQADKLLKNMIVEGVDADRAYIEKGSSITADLWDFAGQQVYYAAHSVFLSSRAVQCSLLAPMLTSHMKILRMLHPRYFVRFLVRNMENM